MRLIDVDELKELIDWTFAKPPFSRKTIKHMIDMARTVDAVPVRHGEWIDSHDPWTGGICSACGYQTGERMGHLKLHYRYCHNCGARMDAERKDNG